MTAMNGVVVMAYGSPQRRDEIAAYYTDIRRGRPPTAEQLADLTRRYDAIGGLSPLHQRSAAQRAAITAALDDRRSDGFVVTSGFRHVEPSIETAIAELVDSGVTTIVGLVLAPHYSSMSIGTYHARAADAAAAAGVDYRAVDRWGDDPTYVEFLASAVGTALAALPAGTEVVFTAHSLPARIVADGDPYPAEVERTATLTATTAGLGDRWSLGWQSAGRTPEPWLTPDITEIIDRAADAGTPGLLVCPCGFTSDHLEVRYDLDIDAAGRAAGRGLPFARTAVVNDDPAVMAALADRIIAAIDR